MRQQKPWVKKMLAKDPDFFKRAGALGGSAETTKLKGAAYLAVHDPEKLRAMASMGGRASKRPKGKA